MFKKLFAILIALMMLCSCKAEETPEPVLPEEPQVSETETEEPPEEEADLHALRKSLEYPGLDVTPCDFEGGYPYKAESVLIPEGAEELLYRIGRIGEFHGVSGIPQDEMILTALLNLDMVEAYGNEELAPIAEEVGNTCFYPREWVMEAAREIFGDVVFHHQNSAEGLFTYHEKAGVYTPPNMGLNTVIPYIVNCSGNDGSDHYTVEFFYMNASMSGYQLGDGDVFVPCEAELNENLFEKSEFIEFVESGKDLYTAFLRIEDGKFRVSYIQKNHYEAELIAEHIAALNMCTEEYFGAEHDENVYYFYFKEKNKDWQTVPDMISDEYFGETTEGYVWDYFERDAYLITNFKTKAEVKEYMGQWIAPAFFETDYNGIDHNFMEANGNLYLLRGNRGYGLVSYGNSEITSKTADKMTAKAYIYQNNVYEAGTAEIKFEKIDGRWIIVSVEDNYY